MAYLAFHPIRRTFHLILLPKFYVPFRSRRSDVTSERSESYNKGVSSRFFDVGKVEVRFRI